MVGEFRKCNSHQFPALTLQEKVQEDHLYWRKEKKLREEMITRMMAMTVMMTPTIQITTPAKSIYDQALFSKHFACIGREKDEKGEETGGKE